jgi:hypothetical protein
MFIGKVKGEAHMTTYWIEFLTILIRENRERLEKAASPKKDAAPDNKPASHRPERIWGWLHHRKRTHPAPKTHMAG